MTEGRIDNVVKLVKALGGPTVVGEWLNIRTTAVSNWSSQGWIPPGWHLRLYLECLRRGLEVDPVLFGVTDEDVRFAAMRLRRSHGRRSRRRSAVIQQQHR